VRADRLLIGIVVAQTLAFCASWLLTFLVGRRVRRAHWLASLATLGAVQGGAGWVAARLTGPLPAAAWIAIGCVALATVALAEDWNALGHACMASTVALCAAFLAYVGQVVLGAHLGPVSLAFSVVLFALQGAALLLLAAGSWEILDVTCRVRWRRVRAPTPAAGRPPRVSLHVPAYNEPPEMVMETLDALARLDYPDYEVVVVDDNTADERTWRPVEAHCRKLGFRFFHLENWPGFKSGALNFALTQTDPAAELVGVVDSDYVVEPGFLRDCVGFFDDPRVAFVQTPQDYRDALAGDRYATACYDAYLYFFKVSMPSRNEHDGIIFAGTMGLLRVPVLKAMGGWDEWCITEDAEISLRILDRGHEGVYLDRSYGRGLMPLDFEGLKKQRFRWAFGGMQILRRHWRALVPWARWRDPSHRLDLRQQWDYLMGGLAWLNDPITLAFTALLLLGAGSLLVAHSLFLQPLAPAVLVVPFVFIFVGVSRFLWAFRARVGCSLGRAAAAFAVLLGLTWVVTLACAQGLTREKGVFLRTPKKRTGQEGWEVLRIVRTETGLAAGCLAAAALLAVALPPSPHAWLMVGLLAWQSVIYGSALVVSGWSRASVRKAERPALAESWRSRGVQPGFMVGARRATAGAALLALLAAIVFVIGVRTAPERERAFRAAPRDVPLVPAAMMVTPPEAQVRATLYFEKQAALEGSVAEAIALWMPDGVIRDLNFTPGDPSDDRVWVGLDRIRARYAEEFAARRYVALAHANAAVSIHGDRAVVVNDLRAELATADGPERVALPRSDRWTLVRGREGWRIRELVVNAAPR
jgi:cellulose synthase/poly-beta-1,6-N-acetylglucosamine synthase-like glycosyltransferase